MILQQYRINARTRTIKKTFFKRKMNSQEYLKKVIQRMRDLPSNHPDTRKFVLEQARLRVGSNDDSFLVDLVEPNWIDFVRLNTLVRNDQL